MTRTEPIRYAGPRAPLLVTLSVTWLAAILWITHASITVSGSTIGLINAAIALPNVVSACLLAGGAVGLAAASLLPERWAPARRLPVPVIGGMAGLATGAVAGTYTVLTWGIQGPVATLAVSFGVAGAVGGALAAALHRAVAVAGLVATLAVLAIGSGYNLFRDRLLDVFGAAESPRSAAGWFGFTVAVTCALVAGLVAFWRLRRAGGAGWPAYLAAGALPGAMLLLAEAVTRLGGAQLLSLAMAGSELDSQRFGDAAGSRLNHALVVLFLGAIIALVAFGRTLPRRGGLAAPDPDSPSDALDEDGPHEDPQPASRSSSDTSYHSSS